MTDSYMDEVGKSLENLDFHHPYTPYEVQEQFMKAVYDVLSTGNGQIGILESPTGTGKSLSLICASLTWLRNHKSAEHEASIEVAGEDFKDEPQWVVDQLLRRKHTELAARWQEREERLEKLRQKEKTMEARSAKRRRIDDERGASGKKIVDEDAEWLVQGEDGSGQDSTSHDPFSGLSKEAREILGIGPVKGDGQVDDGGGLDHEVKIYYTSRTHSQLTQFISELRRPTFPSSLPRSLVDSRDIPSDEAVKHIPLSSRQKLCINPAVSRLGSLAAINDRCSELQQSKTAESCAFIPKEETLAQTHQLRDTALATLPDIEDLFNLGKSLAVCPYYASRTAIPGAEIITLPYPLLLQQSARDALGIKLDGNIVIIDEAHNIMDAIANAHAADIRLSDLRRGRQMLGVYVKRFGKKLKGENRVMVGQVGRVIDGLSEWLDGAMKQKSDQGIVDTHDLLKPKGIDQINMFKLVQYIQDSKLAYKIESYAAHVEEEAAAAAGALAQRAKSATPVLHTLVSFLIALTNLSSEGRVFFQRLGPDDISLSYLLLSPTHAFSSVASSARAIILAGGTMSPFDDYTAHLFPSLPSSKITMLSCGHVIPPSNLCVWTLAGTRPAGSQGNTEFEFSFQKRGDRSMVSQLGLAILNICAIAPDGVVVFLPSYGYLDEVVRVWQGAGPSESTSIWTRLQAKKAIFTDSRSASSDDVLQAYSEAILGESSAKNQKRSSTGALLLSVVGGKMSEGINFSDRLGRCVIIVGLPYPNINSPEWKAKIEYVEATTLSRLLGNEQAGEEIGHPERPSRDDAIAKSKQAARDFYENACMRAVNQSIGRAIRHRGDYAAIVLVDRRYGTERIRRKLPGWIQGGMVGDSHERGVPQLMGVLGGFFRAKKTAGI